MQIQSLGPAGLVLGLLALAGPALAQVPISGPLSDTTTGPLLAGTVYHAVTSLSVATTLTIQPGVIVKFVGVGATFEVTGTLSVQGTANAPVIFTDIKDDSAGGDTNADGPSVGVPGHWTYLRFHSGASASVCDHLEVRYAGRSTWSGITLSGSALTLRDSIVRDCLSTGLQLDAQSAPLVERCHFGGNGGVAVGVSRLDQLARFSACTASGNVGGDFQSVQSHGLDVAATVEVDDLIGGVVVCQSFSISAAGHLTLGPGVGVKLPAAATIEVNGTLDVNGTAGAPAILTSFGDDSVAGDTNGDGPSSGAPGDWTYLRFHAGSNASSCEHLELRYAGRSNWGAITLTGSAPTLRDSVVRDCQLVGLQLDTQSAPIVERCHFQANGGVAVGVTRFDQLAGFSACTASGNAGGDYQLVASHGLTQTALVEVDDLIGGVAVAGSFSVSAVGHLTLGPGVVVKLPTAATIEVNGTLEVNGTASAPTVLTSFADDSVGGDTNRDGASSGAAGDWTYLRFQVGSSASTCEHLELRYAGRSNWGAITLTGSAPTLRDTVVRDSQLVGLQLDTQSAPVVERCHFQGNGGVAVGVTRFDQLAGFSACTASGNAGGDYQLVASHGLAQTALVEVDDLIGGVVVAASFSLSAAGHLTFGPGVVVKLPNSSTVEVSGRLETRGDVDAPVVITSLADDAYGGDINQDGPSVGSAGSWVYLRFHTNGTNAVLQHLVVRYAGRNGWPTILMHGDGHSLRNVRVDHSAADGFELQQHNGVASGLTAWRCAGIGIELAPNGPDVHRSTVVECGTGFAKALTTSAMVVDSIVHLSTSQATVGFVAAEWRYSNGVVSLAGTNGNLFVDPGFMHVPNGDLRLRPSSACIDAGDPLSPRDADGSRADMGAYPYDHARPRLACVQTSAGPCNSWLAMSNGYASVSGASQLVASLFDVPTNTAGIFFYGQSSAPVAFPPFGTVCGLPPYIRAVALSSGGDPNVGPCDGRFDFDVTAYLQTPAGLALPIGTAITGQYWYRDNVAGTVRYSDALRIPIRP